MKVGIIFRLASFWIGIHYSYKCKRLCVNLIPFVTLWVTFEGGLVPNKNNM